MPFIGLVVTNDRCGTAIISDGQKEETIFSQIVGILIQKFQNLLLPYNQLENKNFVYYCTV